jgi:hypothetical protein
VPERHDRSCQPQPAWLRLAADARAGKQTTERGWVEEPRQEGRRPDGWQAPSTLGDLSPALGPLARQRVEFTSASGHGYPPDAARLGVDPKNEIGADRLWSRRGDRWRHALVGVREDGSGHDRAGTQEKQDEGKVKGTGHGFCR